ncbi:arginase [Gammaproteobacteria bacterium]|nr:arginase [Gammaproteobacteria bacterium]
MFRTIGYCFSGAGPDPHANHGPLLFQPHLNESLFAHGQMLYPKGNDTHQNVIQLNTQLCELIHLYLQQNITPLVISADHSSAMGTWSGVAKYTKHPIGLIWVDAHLDAHTPTSSITQNLHGMPVAHLLGKGDNALRHIGTLDPKINPEYLVYIGTRDYEPDELALIQNTPATIYTMQDIKTQGIKTILQKAVQHVSQCPHGYGLSLDIDAFDPDEIPAVSTPAINGIHFDEFCHAVEALDQLSLMALEITEYNANLDQNERTLKAITGLIHQLAAKNQASI